MLRIELPGKRKGERPKKKFLDVVRQDMQVDGMKEEDAGDRKKWKRVIGCGGL